MLFNSFSFILCFLPITFVIFFILGRYAPNRYATLWLVIASFLFYGYWDIQYIPLLFISILFNYYMGKKLYNTHSKAWLSLGIIVNLSLLGYFKYMNFFLDNINTLAGTNLFDMPHVILPLGISFFTFTQIAYLIDTYRKEAIPNSFVVYAEFVTIFPHLIAGPIISYKDMLPQFINPKTFIPDYKNIGMGLSLFSMGLFKKVVIADSLSPVVEKVFTHTDKLTFLEAWIGAISYTFQLYFDFSGYSEMAIGLGLLFNLKLPINFNSPYQATSIIDFWRRWHMTLGLWVKDYLYIPLGGNRHGEWNKMRNLLVSMFLIGLWHGAGWTFIIWGTLHGIFLMVNHQWRRLKIALPKFANWSITFLCVTFAWVFFRAQSVHDAYKVIFCMLDITNFAIPDHGFTAKLFANTGIASIKWSISSSFGTSLLELFILFAALLLLKNPIVLQEKIKPKYTWLLLTCILFLISTYYIGTFGTGEFLYFQF